MADFTSAQALLKSVDYLHYRPLCVPQAHYQQYDGFVVLHGTDTMAYTASALSFMLQNLSKPVVLTGSQIPIFELRSDGRDNFLSALVIAAHYDIPEVRDGNTI